MESYKESKERARLRKLERYREAAIESPERLKKMMDREAYFGAYGAEMLEALRRDWYKAKEKKRMEGEADLGGSNEGHQ